MEVEKRLSLRMQVSEKIERYVRSFSVHGLTKVFRGSRYESLFWLIMLLSGISVAFLIIHGLVVKYTTRGVYTEIKMNVTEFNHFPSVTFCERGLYEDSYYAYCGYSLFHHPYPHKVRLKLNDSYFFTVWIIS